MGSRSTACGPRPDRSDTTLAWLQGHIGVATARLVGNELDDRGLAGVQTVHGLPHDQPHRRAIPEAGLLRTPRRLARSRVPAGSGVSPSALVAIHVGRPGVSEVPARVPFESSGPLEPSGSSAESGPPWIEGVGGYVGPARSVGFKLGRKLLIREDRPGCRDSNRYHHRGLDFNVALSILSNSPCTRQPVEFAPEILKRASGLQGFRACGPFRPASSGLDETVASLSRSSGLSRSLAVTFVLISALCPRCSGDAGRTRQVSTHAAPRLRLPGNPDQACSELRSVRSALDLWQSPPGTGRPVVALMVATIGDLERKCMESIGEFT